MKKIISFLIIAAMLFSTLPVFATEAEPAVTLAYVKNGESYAAGSTVILGASASVVEFDRIDFYANGIKIPGCIKSSGKTLNWTIPTSGKFEIQAFATTTGGESLPSDKITVYGVTNEEEMVFSFDSVSDVTSHAYLNWGMSACTENDADVDFAKKSSYSAKWSNLKANDTFYITGLNANRIGDKYLNYLIYSTNDVTLHTRLVDNTLGYTRPENQTNGYFSLKSGWNSVSIELALLDKNGYYAAEARIADINEIQFYTTYANAIPTGYGFINEGVGLNSQPNLKDTTVYFDSAWLSDEPVAAPKATCSIPTGSTKVCNALDKLTFTFDKEMDFSVLSDADITVKNTTDNTEIENFTLIPSTNTLIVDFAPNTLAYSKEYTVTLGDNIKDFYGKSVDSTTKTFTFTTVQSCEAVEPIVSLTYPEKNATLISNNVTLAAKVIFGGSVKGVAFYEGTNKIADATQGTNGEWYATVDGMSDASHTVKAVVTYGDTNATKETDAVSFTVSEALEYNFTGIKHGEEITLNTTSQPLVSKEIGITPVTNVSKVVYKIDGVEKATVTEAPFTWDMPITAVNKNVVVSADVYSVGVNPVSAVTYKAIYVEAATDRADCTDNFDEKAPNTSFSSANGIFETASNRGGDFAISYVSASDYGRDGNVVLVDKVASSPSKGALLIPYGGAVTDGTGLNPRVRFTFDFYLPEAGNGLITLRGKYDIANAKQTVCDISEYSTNTWHTAEVYLDMISKTITTTIDGESEIQTLTDSLYDYLLMMYNGSNAYMKGAIAFEVFSDICIDNYRTTRVLESERTDLFVNGIKKDVTASGETVNVSVANLSQADSTVSVIFALYSEDDEMIGIWANENVPVKSNEFSQTIQNVPYTVNGKTGTKVKAFCWNNMGEISPVKTIR